MGSEMVSLKVDQTMVSAVLQKQIQAAIVAQLGDQDKLIEQAVSVALSKKVSANGKTSTYERENTYDFLEILAKNSIHEAAKEALKEWLAENSHKVKDAVLKELKKPSRQRSIAVAYANAIESSLQSSWRMDCDIKFQDIRE